MENHMNARWSGLFIAGAAVLIMLSAAAAGEAQVLKFEKTRIGTVTYEACSACDVNKDGILDIVSGEYWFEGPDFKKSHKMCSVQKVDDYFDDFSDFPMDVNGDGYLDIITGGWWGETLRWRENPRGEDKEWTVHDIAKTGNIERGCFWDIDGDGILEAVPNCPGKPFMVFKLARDAAGKPLGRLIKSPSLRAHRAMAWVVATSPAMAAPTSSRPTAGSKPPRSRSKPNGFGMVTSISAAQACRCLFMTSTATDSTT